ncbi:MAG TPA: TonB-dependent receptor [Stellaceae bacterium]|nr:TonB-dependent receptor [Stellaceae bacterium]
MIDVVGTSPLPGIGIDRDKMPANVRTLAAPDTATQGPAGFASGLDQQLGSINLNDNQDNPFQPDVQYRGFEASPILGTPIGVAVYQNGVRLNEPFGDNVNWDLVPDFAINRTTVFPTNPVFGLNALGGALVLGMKNGFNFQGGEAEISGGSFGRRQGTLQYGQQIGNIGAYIGASGYNDDGFRKFSPSQVRQLYADIGAESDRGSLHLNFTGANNRLNGIGPTPIQLVNIDRSGVFTGPQSFHNTLAMSSLTGDYHATDIFSLQSSFYVRSAGRSVDNGNTSEVQACDDDIPDTLCIGDPFTQLFATTGQTVPNTLGAATPGEIDRSSINSLGLGGSLQGTLTAPLFGHGNYLVAGASLDHADIDFTSTNELGIINPSTLMVAGLGTIIAQPDGSLTPVRLNTTNSYFGLYASDTFDVTSRLSLTIGGRYNLALIHLSDQIGTALNGNNRYARLNPAAGATYKLTPDITGYVGYAEANRAPTAGEIACSDPARPCNLDNFLTADPPNLKQVVARTYEAGFRGRLAMPWRDPNGKIDWHAGAFRTDLADDILNVPSQSISSGFFENIGSTRRQGIEAGLTYADPKWKISLDYAYIDATFQSPITLSSPNSPTADDDGNIQVLRGNQLPGIPHHRLKANIDYTITDKWKFGGNLIVASDQYFFGDQSNQNAKLPGYWIVNLHSSYNVTENVEVFALIQNLFDKKYATYGIFGDVTATPLPGVANPSDPRFISAAAPLAVYGGVRIRF